jgi:micrococcal nuclease
MIKRSPLNLFALAFIFLASLAPLSAAVAVNSVQTTVDRVVDGDTIEVKYQGKKEHVRLIGVDTPETVHPSKGVQPYGPEASNFTKKSLTGRQVWLEFDVEARDQYGRLLAYVWTAPPLSDEAGDKDIRDGMFNAALLLQGFGQMLTFPPNVRYVERFREYQTEARDHSRGMWRLSASQSPSGTSPTVTSIYVGNARSKVFHKPECLAVGKMSAKNQTMLDSRSDAINQGFRPCGICKP